MFEVVRNQNLEHSKSHLSFSPAVYEVTAVKIFNFDEIFKLAIHVFANRS